MAEQATSIWYEVTVGLSFPASDAFALRLAAAEPNRPKEERHLFDTAAIAAESGTLVVIQCMTKEGLQEIMACFPRIGVKLPTVQDLRVGHG